MNRMFYNAAAFNGSLGEWDTAQVIDMETMFGSCSAFNQPVGAWDTSKVTTMYRMFNTWTEYSSPFSEKSFNQPWMRCSSKPQTSTGT